MTRTAAPDVVLCTVCFESDDLYVSSKRPVARTRLMNSGICKACAQVDFTLTHTYGVTIQEYRAMLNEQLNTCKICGGVNSNGQRLGVDHDHDTGQVRGLLCMRCNTALGVFKDERTLTRAILYLRGEK